MLAEYMGNSPSYSAYNELPVPPTIPAYTSLSTEGRVRPYYCWLHGHNNTHNGISCKVMAANPAYTGAMKTASSHVGSGGNPKVNVPIQLPLFGTTVSPDAMVLLCYYY